MNKAVAITGMGIVNGNSDNISQFTDNLKKGRSAIRLFEQPWKNEQGDSISVQVAADIPNFDFSQQLSQLHSQLSSTPGAAPNDNEPFFKKVKKLALRTPLPIQLSVLAAIQAWTQAGLFQHEASSRRIGIVIGGQNSTQNYQFEQYSNFYENPEYLNPRFALYALETNQIGILSEIFQIRGEGVLVGGASASGNVALIHAHRMLLAGVVDACLVVGVAADLSPMDMQGYYNIGAMGGKKFAQQADLACRPFDVEHEGFIFAQAGAAMVLESLQSFENRKKSCENRMQSCENRSQDTPHNISQLAQLIGGAIQLDANSLSNPNVEGEIEAMRAAIESCGLSIEDIDYINSHGSSSPQGDAIEAQAIETVFEGQLDRIWINATKGITGHCLFSAGLVEAIASVIQIREHFLHPNLNLQQPINPMLKFCPNHAQDQSIQTCLSNSFGFGGINSSLILAG